MCTVTFEIEEAVESRLADLAERLGMPVDELAKAAATAFLTVMADLDAQREQRLAQRIGELTPDNAELLESAKRYPPPQEWLDSDDNPFEP